MEEKKWATVTKTNGITVAEMMVKRLEAANIPAFALQESVGKSLGLVVGPMSTAHVKVPVEYLEEARLLLDIDAPAAADDIVICPSCMSEIELDAVEWEQGWFECPVCTSQVFLEDIF